MNQDLLRLFKTESDYDSAKDDFVYPTVSYVRDVDAVRYMSKPLLPIIDTTGYATDFVAGEYYPQEALVFKAIYDMYASQIPAGGSNSICIQQGELNVSIWNSNILEFERLDIAYVGNEPLYKNYLINFDIVNVEHYDAIKMADDRALFGETYHNEYLNYSDGLYGVYGPL